MSRVASVAFGIMIANLLALPAACDEGKPMELAYSAWTKVCVEGACFIGRDVRSECGFVAGFVLIERAGEARKTLRVTLPPHLNIERGVRVIIGQGQPITAFFASCARNGCWAEYQGDAELVDQLRQEQALVLQVDRENAPISVTLSLAGFADAYRGPPIQPLVLEEIVRSQKEMQEIRASEEARKLRCDRAPPLP